MTSSLPRRPGPTTRAKVTEVLGSVPRVREDRLATEEPLEIRVAAPGLPGIRVGVTMRTPGHDFELAAGWLVHEGITTRGAIREVRYCSDADLRRDQEFNVVTVELTEPPLALPSTRLINSACGVCGTDAVSEVVATPTAAITLTSEIIRALPEALRARQSGFEKTGGLHAAGLASAEGALVVVREDVGRHNAVDKAVGSALLARSTVPDVLVLSGRVGFELMQKAVVSGITAVVAVGAPTSVAVDLARSTDRTLVGFVSPDRHVVYAGGARVGV